MGFDDDQKSAVASSILASPTPQIEPSQAAKQRGFAAALRGKTPIQQGTTPLQKSLAGATQQREEDY